jgi:hypothetical protein
MERRDFVKSLIAAGGLYATRPFSLRALPLAGMPITEPAANIKRVLVMFKCHFDAGFIDTQTHVVSKYFEQYYPLALQTTAASRQAGNDRYIWTTGSWLLYEYLEQANADQRKQMEQAIVAGDIAWHALPFTWQTEMLDRSMIEGGLALSQSLDKRFGRTTTGAKMTDVPGHTRGIVSPLAAHGVKFLDIGVNGASNVAQVPVLFNWKDPAGAEITVMYHHDYGAVAQVPGSDLAIAIMVANDNSGPHPPEEIKTIYADLRKQFPNAAIKAASLTDIAEAVAPLRRGLPTFTQEIGDTWIYGVASDPVKVARYLEVARLRRHWIEQKKIRVSDAADIALLRHLLLEPEHTWGTDTKTWLDFDHYTPHDLAQVIDTTNYKVVRFSWEEKRKDLFDGIAALPEPLRTEATQQVQSLSVVEPKTDGMEAFDAGSELETPHFILALDQGSGALIKLHSKKSNRDWAAPGRPIGLFSYQTLGTADYEAFFKSYIISTEDWARKDFGKFNMEQFGVQAGEWQASLVEQHYVKNTQGVRILAKLQVHGEETMKQGRVAWPQTMYLELSMPNAEPVIDLSFYWFGKQSNRLPEGLWLTFQPKTDSPEGWSLDKSGQQVSPHDVVAGGNRHMHAVSPGLTYKDAKGSFAIESLDAPIVALGRRTPLYYSNDQPDMTGGAHFSLFNNAWGTNYIMWFGEDMRFRFRLRPS